MVFTNNSGQLETGLMNIMPWHNVTCKNTIFTVTVTPKIGTTWEFFQFFVFFSHRHLHWFKLVILYHKKEIRHEDIRLLGYFVNWHENRAMLMTTLALLCLCHYWLFVSCLVELLLEAYLWPSKTVKAPGA